MASIISAGTTSGTALNMAGDTSGVLQLATNGSTTAITIDTSQRAAFVAGTAAAPAITTTGDTNTGIFFSAADTIDFAEGGVACGQFDSSANFKFNSGYGSVATAYGVRAWITYNGSTGAVIASGGISSVSKLGPGDWEISFSITFPDANYAIAGFVKPTAAQSSYALNRTVQGRHDTAPTTTQCRLSTVTTTAGQEDNENTRVIFIR